MFGLNLFVGVLYMQLHQTFLFMLVRPQAGTCSPAIASSFHSLASGMQLTCRENTPTLSLCQHTHHVSVCVCLLAQGRAQLQSKEVMQSVHIGTQRLRSARRCTQTHKYIYTSHSKCGPSANRQGDSLVGSHSFTHEHTCAHTQSGQFDGQTDVMLTKKQNNNSRVDVVSDRSQ